MTLIPVSTKALTFNEEFNALSASSSGKSTTWMTKFPYGGEDAYTLTPNDEQEYYSQITSGSGSPFKYSNGILDITASVAEPGSNPYGLAYTSGLLTTYASFSQQYGYFEINAKLPAGQGLWPAFWLLPADNSTPAELDVFEMLGSDPSTIYGTTHGLTNGANSGISQAFSVAKTSTGFHTYGVDWEPSQVTFYVDGTKLGSATTPATMNVPMYMLLNLAVGGTHSWPGAPNASTSFPATMSIDYVRAYATAATIYSGGSAANTTITAGSNTKPTPVPTAVVLGSGSNTLTLLMSEDAYLGDAQFTISVDGVQIGGVQTTTASHSNGTTQEFNVKGTFGSGAHTVGVTFVNDIYGPDGDRNLHVAGARLDGVTVPSSTLSEYSNGTQSFTFSKPGPDTLTVGVSEDAYLGDAKYRILVDGAYVGDTYTATASHAAGQINQQTVTGTWGSGPHTVGIEFINDIYGPDGDRNLFVSSLNYNGRTVSTGTIAQKSDGIASIKVPAGDTLTLALSEDNYLGDAQFSLAIDGKQVSTNTTVTASHKAGTTQSFSFTGLSAGTHDVALSFVNDIYGPTGDRNLYLSGASLNGTALSASTWKAALFSNGTEHFSLVIPPS